MPSTSIGSRNQRPGCMILGLSLVVTASDPSVCRFFDSKKLIKITGIECLKNPQDINDKVKR